MALPRLPNSLSHAALPSFDPLGWRRELLAAIGGPSGQSLEAISASFIKEHRPTSLLRRLAAVDERVFEASATNGAALRVDGGVVRTIA
jgi:hypothetical protein